MNEKEKEPIHAFDLRLLASFFSGLDRQGPGDDAETLRALGFIDTTRSGLRVADLGCGSGRQTAVLAEHLDGRITAIDLLPELIAGLEERMKRSPHGGKVTALVGSMDDLPFDDESLDVIWAEGSIYNIGFEHGLTAWRRYLKPGGAVAVTECSWLSAARQPATDFIRQNFPQIATPSEKVRILEQAGYTPLAHFLLPRHCWTKNYFEPAAARIPRFLREQGHSPAAVRLTELLCGEREHYRKYGMDYGYVFYIGRKEA